MLLHVNLKEFAKRINQRKERERERERRGRKEKERRSAPPLPPAERGINCCYKNPSSFAAAAAEEKVLENRVIFAPPAKLQKLYVRMYV